jgi:hypothetical protein
MLGSLPVLPTRSDFGPLMPETLDSDPDDEVILDPQELKRAIDEHSATAMI